MPSAKRRALVPVSVPPARRALRDMATNPTIAAKPAATSQVASHRSAGRLPGADRAAEGHHAHHHAAGAGMAVNVALRSIVWRMNCRFSAAWSRPSWA